MILTVIMTGLGLAADAFSVSIGDGLCIGKPKFRDALKIGLFFGIAQGIMPMLGYFAGKTFEDYIKAVDHWLAFVLLFGIGLSMIRGALTSGPECDCKKKSLSLKELFVQAFATSIDAFAVGISFLAMPDINIYIAAAIICAVTLILSIIGVFIGKSVGKFLKGKAEIVGGVVLIFIGIKILLEHLGIFF